ncbi:MAG: tetratricopeptide repeat protein, partial [Bacteroidia bacterium]
MSCCVFSQKADSLINLIDKSANDSNKVKLQLKVSSLLQGSDVTRALFYAERAIDLARKLNTPRLLVRATNNAGHLYDYVNFSEKAIIYHQNAIAICEKNHLVRELGDSYNWLGGVFYNKGNYDLAAHNWIIALKLRQQTGNKTGIAGSLNNIGEVYRLKGNADTALRYYRKAVSMNEVLNDKHFLSINYSNIGLVYQSQKKYEQAEEAFTKALDYAQQVNNTEQLALVNNSFGNYFLELGDYQQAYNYYTRGLNFASSCASMVEKASAYKGLALAGRGLKLPVEAFENFTKYQAINDTLNNLEKNRQVIDIGVRYETEKKERELEQLKSEKSISELTERHKQVLIYVLLSGLVFLLIMAVALFYNNRSRRKLNTQLNDRLSEINKSINYAKKIQNTLLANENFMRQTLPNHFIFYRSKDIVSGDFYWASSVNTLQKAESIPGSNPTVGRELFYLAVCD